MPNIATVLSFLLPGLLFVHAIWRLFCAGTVQRRAFCIVPAMTFAVSSLWIARSATAAGGEGLSAAAAQAQLAVGPLLVVFLVGLTELPFLALYLHERKAAKRSKTPK